MPTFDDAEQLVHRARAAFHQWKSRGLKERLAFLSALRRIIVRDLDSITARITRSTGKVDAEALNSDILPTLEILKYYEKNAESILKPKKKKTPFLFYKNYSYIEYKPVGVVLVIGPWNCPLQLALVPAVSALIAGNAVIVKPSEVTADVGTLIGALLQEAGVPEHVVQVVAGGKEVGELLIQARPDSIFFTGSVATGKKIMAAAAEHVIPLVLELGGKDPMIVFDDAQVERAVNGAVYGAFAHAGQLCVSVERLYVQETIYESFAEQVARAAGALRAGTGLDADFGPITAPFHMKRIEEQIEDALRKGAKLITAIKKEGSFLFPVVIKDVNHEMNIMQEETFGPVLPIMPFSTEAEAIALANDSAYGLNASVWTRDIDKGKRVVNQLETGNAYINDVLKNIGNPVLPFGGVKQSGFRKYHGPDGLYAFCIETAVMVNENKGKREMYWFPFDRGLPLTIKKLLAMLYGNLSFSEKIKIFLSMRDLVRKHSKAASGKGGTS